MVNSTDFFKTIYNYLINALIFIFFALSVNYEFALTVSVLVLVIIGFLLFLYKLSRNEIVFKEMEEQLFVIVMFILPSVTLMNMLFHGFYAEKYRILAKLYQGIFIYLAVKNARINKNLLMLAILIGLIFSSWNSIYEVFYLNINRAHAYMNPITYGESALIFGAIGAILSVEEKMNFKNIFLLFIYWLLGVFVLTMSQTRGGLPFIFVFFYFLIKMFHNVHIPKDTIFKIVFLLFFFTIIIITTIGSKNGYTKRLKSIKVYTSYNEECKNARPMIWKYGFYIFKTNPIFGVGHIGLKKQIKKDIKKGKIPPCFVIFNHLHNDIIDFSAEIGIVGFLSYSLFILGLFFIFKNKKKKILEFSVAWQFVFVGMIIPMAIFTFSLTDCICGTIFRTSIYTTLISLSFGITAQKSKECLKRE